jgi:hypothetical protein
MLRFWPQSSVSLAAIISLADDIPEELLSISGADYTNLVVGLESMGAAIDRWNHRGGDDPPRTIDQKSPVYIVREALKKCPDQNPAPETTDLAFIPDAPLRESIRSDISSASDALHRNDYKAATVLAGSAIEAMLLWVVKDAGIKAAPAGLQIKGPPERWDLSAFILVVQTLGRIKQNTVTQCELTRNFRNLIHPGRAERLGESCDRGTAHGALAGVALVVRDLTPP